MTKIPSPKGLPILGNLGRIDNDRPVDSLSQVAKEFDGIFRIVFPHRTMIILSSQKYVDEVCDEARFGKKIHQSLTNIRSFAGDGLFTARTDEDNWKSANKILAPAFGQASLKNLYEPMMDIAEQMLLKWERFGDGLEVDIADNFTRLTLDTIALASFDFRFNSFYDQKLHPFVNAMVDNLTEAGARARRPGGVNKLFSLIDQRFDENTQFMHELADQIIQNRKNNPAP